MAWYAWWRLIAQRFFSTKVDNVLYLEKKVSIVCQDKKQNKKTNTTQQTNKQTNKQTTGKQTNKKKQNKQTKQNKKPFGVKFQRCFLKGSQQCEFYP